MKNFNESTHIHFIGLGGIGVSAIARYFLARGVKVSGSDRAPFQMAGDLRARGARVFTKHSAKNLPKKCDALVYSSAVPETNPEFEEAKRRGIPMFEYSAALGEIMKENFGIGVSGTNGKTTTTAMLGKILEGAKLDPMVVVGGKVPSWDANLRLPKKRKEKNLFVAEACEYRRHFLNLNPRFVVLTNIEADHLDYFSGIEDIKDAFREYVSRLPKDGFLAWNADDPVCAEVARSCKAKKASYGFSNKADLRISESKCEKGKQSFRLKYKNKDLGVFRIGVPGKFNVMNASAAALAAILLGAPSEKIKKALAAFRGTWRRFEKVGRIGGTDIISDYAHHPTAVSATIRAARDLYGKEKILFVFQPHQKDRTLKLKTEFEDALSEADYLILAEIYEVAGRNDAPSVISSRDIVEKLLSRKDMKVKYAPTHSDAKKIIRRMSDDFRAVVVMGAGDIYLAAENLFII